MPAADGAGGIVQAGGGPAGDDPRASAADPELVLPRRLLRLAEDAPERRYLSEAGGATLSYQESVDRLLRWCTVLEGLGVGGGAQIANALPSSADSYLVWMACACLGGVEVAMNPQLPASVLRTMWPEPAPRGIICRADDEAHLRDAFPAAEILVAGATSSPADTAPPGRIRRLPAPKDVATVIYTSGSTGNPKGAKVTWGQLSAGIGRIPAAWLSPADAAYGHAPWAHITSRTPFVLMAGCGGRVVVRPRFSAGQFWDDVRRHGVTTTTALVPILLQAPERPDDRDNPLRVVFDGWATAAQARRFQDRFGPRVVSSYGATEIGFPICNRDAGKTLEQHCGWLRPGYRARLVKGDGQDAAAGETGELWLQPASAEMIFAGYLSPGDTDKAFSGGWYRTRDLMLQRPDGAYVFAGRTIDVLRRYGENISPAILEGLVCEDPSVGRVVVGAVPSEVAGQDLVFVVQPQGPAFDEASLYERLTRRLPKYMWPSQIIRADGLAALPTGKLDRRAVLDEALRRAAWTPGR